MGLIGGIGRAVGWAGHRVAMRSKWLARRLWLIAVAEGALVSWRHWRRLEPDERRRLIQIAKKSKGRPSKNLSKGERLEAEVLLDKLGHLELAGNIASIALPFRPLSSLATRFLRGRHERAHRELGLAPVPASPPARGTPAAEEREKAGSQA
jgi:hypothetical protein